MEWALAKSCWILLQKTISRPFISQAPLFNPGWEPFFLCFNIYISICFFLPFNIFFEPAHLIIFWRRVHLILLSFFWRNYIIFLSLIYLISISFNYHNFANIFIHAVIEWHQIFLFPFFILANIYTHIRV